jgi:hypothetical protein
VNPAIRRLSACAVLGGTLLLGATLNPTLTSAQSCDPAYVNYCVPAYAEVGDLDRDEFYA